jgi:hypothetical protein
VATGWVRAALGLGEMLAIYHPCFAGTAKYFLVKIQKKSKFFYGKKFVFSRQG